MNDGQLIDLVHSYPHLYDKARSDFKDDRKKENSWGEIALLLKYSAAECKARWKYLREKYCRQRNLSRPSGSGADTTSQWEFFPSLSWLEPYIQKRKTKTNLGEDNASQDFSQLTVVIDENSQGNLNSPAYSQIAGSPEPNSSELEESATPALAVTPIPTTRKRKLPNNNNSEISSSFKDIGQSMISVAEVLKEKHGSNENEDEDMLFGKTVTSFLKRQKNAHKKKQFKKKIFIEMMDFSDDE